MHSAQAESSKTKVALFGGSFDPPHKAHENIPLFLLQHKLADEVWYVPVKLHPFGKDVSAEQDRLIMLQKVVEDILTQYSEYKDKIRIETWELDHEPESYTINTLDNLSQRYPQHHFSWVIGTDNLEKFHLWQDYKRILNEYGVFVYPRSGYHARPLRVGMHYLGNGPLYFVSSSELRQKFQSDHPQLPPEVVLPAVTEYATTHQLYNKKTI